MKLNKNSWHVKLVYFTFGEYPLPKSLCPYFWTLISAMLLSLLQIIPLPLYMFPFFRKDLKEESGLKIVGVAIMIYITILLGINVLCALFLFPFSHDGGMILNSVIFWMVGVGIGISELIKYSRRKTSMRRQNKLKEAMLPLTEGVKSIFKRICPIIEWQDKIEEK
jgi:hypothetical protein